MFQHFREALASLLRRYRSRPKHRFEGLVLTLLVEALMVLVVVTLGSSVGQHDSRNPALTAVEFASGEKSEAKPAEAEEHETPLQPDRPSPTTPVTPAETPPELTPKKEQQPAQPLIRLSRSDMAALDISNLPQRVGPPSSAKPSRMMGPVDSGSVSRDSPRVDGTGPNGEPLYAASWYREPYDDELSGYLSTATGPGWGLIACRTAPDFRVEDCVALDEYPTGSRIARAVVAAAWQFRVRPPRVGGQLRIGEWVRIRIDYDYKRK